MGASRRGAIVLGGVALAALFSVLGLVLPVVGAGADPLEEHRAAEVARGRKVFQAFCASCHGPNGAGDGPVATELEPKPRDLGGDSYRFGDSKRDLFALITNGAAARGGAPSMQPFGSMLSEPDRWALVAFIRSLKPGDSPGSRGPE